MMMSEASEANTPDQGFSRRPPNFFIAQLSLTFRAALLMIVKRLMMILIDSV